MANQVDMPTPPAPIPSGVAKLANTVLHYDIIVAGALTGAMSLIHASFPAGESYAQWLLYALMGLAIVMKLFGATTGVIATTMLRCFCLGVFMFAIVRCNSAQRAAATTDAQCLVNAYDTSDAGTIEGKVTDAAYTCRQDTEAALSTLKANARAVALDAGPDTK